MSKHMSSSLKHLTLGALLLALCGACIIPISEENPSATEVVTGPSAIGRAIPFSFDLIPGARAFPVHVAAQRSCGAGRTELVFDGVTTDTSSSQRFAPGTLGATTSGTILIVPPENERDPIEACNGRTETIRLTVTVETNGTGTGTERPTVRVETVDGV